MQSSNIPSKIPLPFAYNAGAGYKNTIPTASQIGITNGRASLADGFPPLTFTPINSGGVPPFGSDMNGILYEITSIQQWQQAGGTFSYDSAFSTAVGGYPLGSFLPSNTGKGYWLSVAENNITNPDTTGGADWVPFNFYGGIGKTLSGSSVTLTNQEAAWDIITLVGTLTTNCNLILPTFVKSWILINSTTGAYNLQVKTASGTGVNLAQGASTYVYGDGTNIYFADSAKVASFNGRTGSVSLTALDVTNALGYTPPTPTGGGASGTWNISVNGGTGFFSAATNGQSLNVVNPNGGTAITIQGNPSANGGILRWVNNANTVNLSSIVESGSTALTVNTNSLNLNTPTLTRVGNAILDAGNFNSYAPSLSGVGATGTWNISINGGTGYFGAPTNGQSLTALNPNNGFAFTVYGSPSNNSGIIRFVNNANTVGLSSISENGTGNLNITTSSLSRSGNQVIDASNIANYFPFSHNQNGYVKLPGGCIMQWGLAVSGPTGQCVFNYPIAFPNNALSVQAVYNVDTFAANFVAVYSYTFPSNTGVSAIAYSPSGVPANGAQVFFLVIGF